MNYKTIEHKKIILSKFEFKPSMQGGFYSNEVEVCKVDFNTDTIEQKEKIIKNIFSWLDCTQEKKLITKVIKDIEKNEYTIFKQAKSGLKTELLKQYSLKIEKTTSKQYQLI
jgi:hypothetical protein